VWLTPKASYNVDFETMIVRIASVGELPILGYPRNLKEYMSWRMREARLVIKDGKAFLKVEKGEENVELKESIAVDVNMRL
jgi:hypothetical protein